MSDEKITVNTVSNEEIVSDVVAEKPDRSYNSGNSVDDRMLASRIGIDGALSSPEIMACFEKIGFGEAKFSEGKALLDSVLALTRKQREDLSLKNDAYDSFTEMKNNLDNVHRDRVKLARVLFKDDEQKLTALGLDEKKKNGFSGWVNQISLFYTNAMKDPEIISVLTGIGVDEAEANNVLGRIQLIVDMKIRYEELKGSLSETTKERNTKLKKLDRFMSDMRVFAKVALKDHPAFLRKLGF